LQRTLKLVGAFAAFIIIAITIQYTVAFIRIPGVVARLEQSGNLPLELSEFHGQRLNWLQETLFANGTSASSH